MRNAMVLSIQESEHINLDTKKPTTVEHLERLPHDLDVAIDAEDVEIQLHLRTWLTLVAFWLLNYVQVVALQGPTAVLTYIGRDLHNTKAQSWLVVVLSVVQAVVGPIISAASDSFQARKALLVGTCAISFIGACIAPGSQTIYRLIGANILIGVGFAAVPLAYAVPSEIVPRRWRPLAQSGVNSAALIATISGPFAIGALTKANPEKGWREFYWLQASLWGITTLAILVAYNPPQRRSQTPELSFWQKFSQIDLIGCGTLGVGLTAFLSGLGLGGTQYPWSNARVLAPLIVGVALLIGFGLYEWKGTSAGFLNHDLFRGGRNEGRTFALCVLLLFFEGVMIFGYGLFNPILSLTLFSLDPVTIVARSSAAWIAAMVFTPVWGYTSTRFRTIREPLIGGFVLFTGGSIGMATIQPGQSISALACSALLGAGFGAPLTLIVTGVQLSTPHKLIATATACTTSSRALAGAVFSAIYAAAFERRLTKNLPNLVAEAAIKAGLPKTDVPALISALSVGDIAALSTIKGISPSIIAAGTLALQQAYADAIRIVYIIGAPFGILAIVTCCFLGDLRRAMNYRTDAPVENIYKVQHPSETV